MEELMDFSCWIQFKTDAYAQPKAKNSCFFRAGMERGVGPLMNSFASVSWRESHLIGIQLGLVHWVGVFDNLHHIIPKALGIELLPKHGRPE